MHACTIINQFCAHPCVVFQNEHIESIVGAKAPFFEVRPRKGAKAICSRCQKPAPSYDTQRIRLFQFVPFWGLLVFFRYAMRRVECQACGVKVEKVPWGDGKSPVTTTLAWVCPEMPENEEAATAVYAKMVHKGVTGDANRAISGQTLAWFIAHWAKHLSWTETARQFALSWARVFLCVEKALDWGRAHMTLDGVRAIGIDKVARAKGHQFATLVYQIDAGCRRLLYIAKDRKESSLREFFSWFTPKRASGIGFVCSDMWNPYLNVIKECAPNALSILDRFHVMVHFSKAIDEVRAGEARALAKSGKGEALKHSR
jgi:transposase